MAAAQETQLGAIDTTFINRTHIGIAGGNFMRGLIWGNVAALSQSFASAFFEQLKVAKPLGQAVDLALVKREAFSKLKVFWPSFVAHAAVFSIYRGSVENKPGATKTGIGAMIQPLAVVSIPTVAYAAYYRAMPPQALRLGLYSCVLLHLYDRCLTFNGVHTENMPLTRLNRRVW